MKIKLKQVHYLPKELESGVLYYSKEFEIAIHLCPSGCGSKVRTPIGPAEWEISVKSGKPSLTPSVGSWQLPCRSHYWITDGEIIWSESWTQDQIIAGRLEEESRRMEYYEKVNKNNTTFFDKLVKSIKKLLKSI